LRGKIVVFSVAVLGMKTSQQVLFVVVTGIGVIQWLDKILEDYAVFAF
jgi:hypothetical protein